MMIKIPSIIISVVFLILLSSNFVLGSEVIKLRGLYIGMDETDAVRTYEDTFNRKLIPEKGTTDELDYSHCENCTGYFFLNDANIHADEQGKVFYLLLVVDETHFNVKDISAKLFLKSIRDHFKLPKWNVKRNGDITYYSVIVDKSELTISVWDNWARFVYLRKYEKKPIANPTF